MTGQEIADRLEIADLLARYADAVDRQELDRLDEIFTADAVIDYSAFGGPRGDLSSTKAFLAKALAAHRASLHLLGQSLIVLAQDAATAKTACHNPMTYEDTSGTEHSYVCGLYYHDRLVRTDEGWRIIERVEEKRYLSGLGSVSEPSGVAPAGGEVARDG